MREIRLCDDCEKDELIRDNSKNLKLAEKIKLDYILIDEKYEINF
jgi:hypothetical protein